MPVVIPGWNGEVANKWHLSAENAVAHAEKHWTRMRAVKSAQGYQLTLLMVPSPRKSRAGPPSPSTN
jgi:hypothetical protein